MNSIAFRLNLLRQRITAAAQTKQRLADDIRLLAVSKAHTVDEISRAYHLGLRHFGESRWQEAAPKLAALHDHDIEWHFIGRIQSNKIRHIAQHFSWVESIESEKIARLFNKHACITKPLNVCIQVNIDNDPNKAGVLPSAVLALAHSIITLPHLKLRGLMTVLEKHVKLTETQGSYHRLKMLYDELAAQKFNVDTLSMGMSADFELAIAEGATQIRVGTDLFGPRTD